MNTHNPFKKIKSILQGAGLILAGLLFIGFVVFAIWTAVAEYSWHILWQVPLLFAVMGLIFWGISGICIGIAKVWRMMENRWDRKHGTSV